MNQILKPERNTLEKTSDNNHFQESNVNKINVNSKNSKFLKSNLFYLFQFLVSFCVAICFLVAFFIRMLHLHNKESISNELMKSYQLSTLYSDNTNYSIERIQITSDNSTSKPFVIGMIKIDKINVNYPLLSESSKDLLNISVCRFAGPMPNEKGNLCIAGHNYVDYKFFSRLHELEKGDKVKIYDLNGQMKEYSIFQKYETKADDISCTSQDTNGKILLTLLTCNNVSGKRLVLVANSI